MLKRWARTHRWVDMGVALLFLFRPRLSETWARVYCGQACVAMLPEKRRGGERRLLILTALQVEFLIANRGAFPAGSFRMSLSPIAPGK